MSEEALTFTVLVVDDESIVREVLSLILEENGGKVLIAADGQEAVEIFKQHIGYIDVVLLDFSMPHMNGYEAFQLMKAIDPTPGFIMGSGLAVTTEVAAAQAKGQIEYLSKPFQEAELMSAVRRALKKH